MPDVMVLPDSIARRRLGASDVRVFANGGLGASGVQTARGGHRDHAQLEHVARAPHRPHGRECRYARTCPRVTCGPADITRESASLSRDAGGHLPGIRHGERSSARVGQGGVYWTWYTAEAGMTSFLIDPEEPT